MREPKKTAKLETVILTLLSRDSEVSIRSIAAAAGLSKDDDTERKVIRRALLSLEERKLIVPEGAGRSRVYVLSGAPAGGGPPTEAIANKLGSFKGIVLSPDSKALLEYVSKDVKERAPVGYDQDFLRSYEPNRSFYLPPDHRETLAAIGRVEAIDRPAGTYARNILNRLLIDLSWNSSRLEGNTYSLLETKRLIEFGEEAAGKDASEAQMILNHKAAIEYAVESADEDRITPHEIYSLHALLSENLLGDPAASGRLRSLNVGIGGSTYMPLENPQIGRAHV